MKIERLKEPVKVRADFSGGTITPLAFCRKHQTYPVDRVNCRWKDRQGEEVSYFFSVESKGDLYEIRLRQTDMTWWVERVILDG